MNKVLVFGFGVATVVFAAAFGIHYMLFQTRGYSCVHGIQMIFYGLNTWGCGIMTVVLGGKKK